MARAAPSAEGWVMWEASADMPKPTISAWMRAPRARAASSGSSTSMAAPSPRIMPRRSLENGRQVSGETTRMASQALRMPQLKGASLPPVMASGGTGGGNGEAGAGDAELHGNVGSAGVGHGLGDGQRVHAVAAVLVNFLKADVLGGLAADAGAGDDRGIFAQLGGPLGGGIGDGFARGDDGELGEAVHEIGAAILEVRTVGVVGDLGAVLKTDP